MFRPTSGVTTPAITRPASGVQPRHALAHQQQPYQHQAHHQQQHHHQTQPQRPLSHVGLAVDLGERSLATLGSPQPASPPPPAAAASAAYAAVSSDAYGSSRGGGGPGAGTGAEARLWRFGADTSRVPRRAAEDPTWDITPELMAAFRQLAETMCPILTHCKQRCRRSKIDGSMYALEQLSRRLRSMQPRTQISMEALSSLCHALLAAEEMDRAAEIAPMAPPALAQLPHGSGVRAPLRGARGWEDVDSMFLEPEFKLGSLAYTLLYKSRTREIRLAFVCGARDALSDVVGWSEVHQNSSTRTVNLGELLDVISQALAELDRLLTVASEERSATELPLTGSPLRAEGAHQRLQRTTSATAAASAAGAPSVAAAAAAAVTVAAAAATTTTAAAGGSGSSATALTGERGDSPTASSAASLLAGGTLRTAAASLAASAAASPSAGAWHQDRSAEAELEAAATAAHRHPSGLTYEQLASLRLTSSSSSCSSASSGSTNATLVNHPGETGAEHPRHGGMRGHSPHEAAPPMKIAAVSRSGSHHPDLSPGLHVMDSDGALVTGHRGDGTLRFVRPVRPFAPQSFVAGGLRADPSPAHQPLHTTEHSQQQQQQQQQHHQHAQQQSSSGRLQPTHGSRGAGLAAPFFDTAPVVTPDEFMSVGRKREWVMDTDSDNDDEDADLQSGSDAVRYRKRYCPQGSHGMSPQFGSS